MVPGWTEREFHALNSLRSEWIRASQMNAHTRKTRAGPGIAALRRALLTAVTRSATRRRIAHGPTNSDVTASTVAPGRWQVIRQQTMNGGTK